MRVFKLAYPYFSFVITLAYNYGNHAIRTYTYKFQGGRLFENNGVI